MSNILNKMNEEQTKAILATDGPVIVLAGAGSGKTRVLVHKVLYLIQEKNIPPHAILMVTFTNKAAGEMKERITNELLSLGLRTSPPTVGTFHSLCARILRVDGEAINISRNYVIYDTNDQIQTVKDAMNLLSIQVKDAKPRSVLSAISQNKNQLIDPVSYASFARGRFQELVAKIYPLYQQLMRDREALDFDDLLLETIRLFRTHPDILQKYQTQFQYVLIDEYQDTNHAQYELSKMLSGIYKNICIVGDFSQSIYSFRGADFRNLKKFQKDFPDAQVFPLSQNYRSTQNILDAAYSVISKNTSHPVLNLWTENPSGEELRIIQTENEHQEIEQIIRIIHLAMDKDPNLMYSDVAILYRMNAQSRTIEEVLLHHSIPYVLVGGLRFYERKEIKDVLSYLSYLSTQKDAVALKRIEKLGKKRLSYFFEYLVEFETNGYHETKSTIEILDEVVRQTQYLGMYDEKDPEDVARLENLRELRSVALEFPKLVEFLQNVSLVEQEYRSDKTMVGKKPNAITLMTLHAAKGLEFSMVFMVGMEEGLFPHSQALFDTSELEEERRLCYVGITRAKTTLTLSFAKRRLFFGQRLTPTVSRFILELPTKVVEKNLRDIPLSDPDFF
jgi:DNA helicase-2/ATP-dependent DNA helicase PcrA